MLIDVLVSPKFSEQRSKQCWLTSVECRMIRESYKTGQLTRHPSRHHFQRPHRTSWRTWSKRSRIIKTSTWRSWFKTFTTRREHHQTELRARKFRWNTDARAASCGREEKCSYLLLRVLNIDAQPAQYCCTNKDHLNPSLPGLALIRA